VQILLACLFDIWFYGNDMQQFYSPDYHEHLPVALYFAEERPEILKD
jgi:hypothetical protein